jgi:hypothetical protein
VYLVGQRVGTTRRLSRNSSCLRIYVEQRYVRVMHSGTAAYVVLLCTFAFPTPSVRCARAREIRREPFFAMATSRTGRATANGFAALQLAIDARTAAPACSSGDHVASQRWLG